MYVDVHIYIYENMVRNFWFLSINKQVSLPHQKRIVQHMVARRKTYAGPIVVYHLSAELFICLDLL